MNDAAAGEKEEGGVDRNARLVQKLQENGRRSVNHHRWDRITDSLASLLCDCFSPWRRGRALRKSQRRRYKEWWWWNDVSRTGSRPSGEEGWSDVFIYTTLNTSAFLDCWIPQKRVMRRATAFWSRALSALGDTSRNSSRNAAAHRNLMVVFYLHVGDENQDAAGCQEAESWEEQVGESWWNITRRCENKPARGHVSVQYVQTRPTEPERQRQRRFSPADEKATIKVPIV